MGILYPDAFLACGVYRSFIDTSTAENIQNTDALQDTEANPYRIKAHVIINTGEKGFRFKDRWEKLNLKSIPIGHLNFAI